MVTWIRRTWRDGFGRRRSAPEGFFWKIVGEHALASGTDWNQEVARETFRRNAIKRLVEGTRRGVNVAKAIKCVATESRGRPAVQISINGTVIGWIPDDEATEFHAELRAIAPGGKATAKGHISAGSDGAEYRVRLSVARPLRLRTA